MPFTLSTLWKAPNINTVNRKQTNLNPQNDRELKLGVDKATSIPALNPFNTYGRVFLLSWWGFFVAFWSWYAFPPLMTATIKEDLNLSQADIANSNVISLVATLLVRLSAGTACDRFGPRWTFAAILLAGAIPTALAGTVTTPQGLILVRFFVGILGGSFIPCQVWTTGFFDKNVVGTANSLAAGFGNAGSGVTYFVMPAILNSLVQRQHLTDHVAWRVAFVVPFVLITFTAVIMIVTCPDTPTGPWSSRSRDIKRHHEMRETFLSVARESKVNASSIDSGGLVNDTIRLKAPKSRGHSAGPHSVEDDLLAAASWELVDKPTIEGSTKAIASLPTWAVIAVYFCSFGTELSINSFLGAYYNKTFPTLGQTGSGNWAAMFGMLNAVFRPAGGIISDIVYRYTQSLWAKKILMHGLGLFTGIFLIIIGLEDSHSKPVMFGLVTGLAFFLEAANGACFSLVPHVHPTSNGKLLDYASVIYNSS
jgi:NNP family nitrate/nitrite transporter-like MFS transporter